MKLPKVDTDFTYCVGRDRFEHQCQTCLRNIDKFWDNSDNESLYWINWDREECGFGKKCKMYKSTARSKIIHG